MHISFVEREGWYNLAARQQALTDGGTDVGLRRSKSSGERAASASSDAVTVAEPGADRGERYRRYVSKHLSGDAGEDVALRRAIGGEFDAIGQIQADLLIAKGLGPDGRVIDVGCGSGRLALPLSRYLNDQGSYVGTDVVPELLDYAKRLTNRDNFEFHPTDRFAIPSDADSADIVCFFSVFTHLRHEHSYRYLREAKRLLKPGGRIIFSFLEFAIYSHWEVFRLNVKRPFADKPLDQFMSRDAIDAWAHHLQLEVTEILNGDEPNIPLSRPVTMGHGVTYTDFAPMGQSVAILTLPAGADSGS